MTAASALVFPGSRVLAGWWPTLAPLQPRHLWVGHFLFHRVEALVEITRPVGLDPFRRLVLQALDLMPGPTVQGLDAHLHLGPQVLTQVLRDLQTEGLAERGGQGEWLPTGLARQVLNQGSYEQISRERHVFHFRDRPRPPQALPFLHLCPHAATPWSVPADWSFDPDLLDACLRQSTEWKRQHGFPVEVRQVLGVRALNGGAPAPGYPVEGIPEWQRIILDQPERLLAVVAVVPAEDGGTRLLGFAVKQEGWILQAAEPVFALEAGWHELFPELAEDVPMETWRQAWRAWCQQRGLPLTEADACTLERRECRLHVRASAALLGRLRAARSDALKGEAWLLAGTGNVRSLALLEMSEPGA